MALVRAEALQELGRTDDALAALEGATAPGDPGAELKLLRGRIMAGRGDPAGERDLESLLGGPHEPEARYWLAEAAGVQGDQEGLLEGLRAVWVDARPGGWDTRAAERLTELGAAPGTDDAALAKKRLSQLHRHHRVSDALELAKALQGAEPEDRAALVEWGAIHFAARDYAGALAAWQKALGAPAEASGSPDELFDYALCTARTGDYDTAAIIYRRLIEAHPSSRKADFASFKLGYMEFDRNECTKAVSLLAEHRKRYPSGRHVDEALWFAARCEWRQGEHEEAAALYRELQSVRPKSSLVPGAAYWQARALGVAGDETEERRALQEVLDRWPTSGYAWFAAQRLHTSFAPRPPATRPPWPTAWTGKAAVKRADALLEVGLRRWAWPSSPPSGRPRTPQQPCPSRGLASSPGTTAAPRSSRAPTPRLRGALAATSPSRRASLAPSTPWSRPTPHRPIWIPPSPTPSWSPSRRYSPGSHRRQVHAG